MSEHKSWGQCIVKISIFAISLFSFLSVTGCAMPSRSDSMTVAKADLQQSMSKKECQYTNNVCIGTIAGGKETHPLWMSKVNNKEFQKALEHSLTNLDFYNPTDKARYLLNARLEKLKQPIVGLDMTVTCISHYQIFDQKLKKMIFEKTLTTPYTAKFSSALIGMERLKQANEGAVKENIKVLMKDLYENG